MMRRWQRDCAMVFQQFNLVPRLDVVTNVMLGRLNGHGTLKSLFNIFSADDVGAPSLRSTGSASSRRRKNVPRSCPAASSSASPSLAPCCRTAYMVLADEPIASLDPMNAKIVMDALRRIHERDNKIVTLQSAYARYRPNLLRPGDRHARRPDRL
jgi:phosphonate transport system ATP-binding protein